MPATIYIAPFDSSTPPALPAGVTSEGDIVTTTAHARSGANGITNNSASFGRVLYTTAQDGNNGDARQSVAFLFHGASADGIAEILCRIQVAPLDTCYRAVFDRAVGSVTLYSRSGGVQNLVTVVGGAAFADDIWYYATLTTTGDSPTTVSVRLSRDLGLSDGFYFHPTGSWLNNTPVDCISTTDTAVGAGQGNGGIRLNFGGSSANTVYMDDFLFETMASAHFTITPTLVPSNASGRVLTLAGVLTAFDNSTTIFTLSGVTGATKTAQNVSSATAATVTITTGAGTGILTITESVTGSAMATTEVGLGMAAGAGLCRGTIDNGLCRGLD